MDKNLEYCDCGRYYCQFFNGSEGERGTSYSLKEVQEFLDRLPILEEHLKKELARYHKAKEEN